MEITDFVVDSKFTFGDYDYWPGYRFSTLDTSFGAKPEIGDRSADYTITDVKNITDYESLDEAEEAFNQAVYEASDPRRDSDVKSITLLCTDTYDGTDEYTEVAVKEFCHE